MTFSQDELYKMSEDIRAVNVKLGWQPHSLETGEIFALLHSEVAEMTEAYRNWGLADATRKLPYMVNPATKPEGVGSEMADVLIRLLDDAEDFHTYPNVLNMGAGRFGFSRRFGTVCNTLHTLIAKLSMAVDSYECCPLPEEIPLIAHLYRDVYQYLVQAAEFYGIDLRAEYERKLAYNKTRQYRHGGKKM